MSKMSPSREGGPSKQSFDEVAEGGVWASQGDGWSPPIRDRESFTVEKLEQASPTTTQAPQVPAQDWRTEPAEVAIGNGWAGASELGISNDLQSSPDKPNGDLDPWAQAASQQPATVASALVSHVQVKAARLYNKGVAKAHCLSASSSLS